VTSYSRQDVLRILQITSRQLQGWERARLIASKQCYSFQDLGQLRTLRALREEAVSAASIRNSIVAMRAVSGMANPLLEACLVRTGTRIAFRHSGAIVDPIRRQLLFDFERLDQLAQLAQLDQLDQLDELGQSDPFARRRALSAPIPLRHPGIKGPQAVQERFLAAVQAEEAGEGQRAIELYQEILTFAPTYAPAYINLGTIHFHLRQFAQAEKFYRSATLADPTYVLAFFDLGNALDELQRFDESIAAYRQAVALAPGYADAHYNLALAYEHKAQCRPALRHWEAYLRLDATGPWADHARGQIRLLLSHETLSIAWRANHFLPPRKGMAALALV
jgi:tetratricopeptide (TPR) repeat protein